MRRIKRPAFALLGAALLMGAAPARASEAGDKAAIRQVIADMEAAWNRGDFRGYMAGFLNPGVVFVSRGRFQRDWQGRSTIMCATMAPRPKRGARSISATFG